MTIVNRHRREFDSAATAVASAVTVACDSEGMLESQISVQMFESDGTTRNVATGGTFLVEVKTPNTEWFETQATIDATAPTTLTPWGEFKEVRVTPTAVAGNDVTTYVVSIIRFSNANEA